ncbi:MAG: hypothetical protein AB1391_00095 [Candidatus Micrarchaeota archaeon]
MGFLAHIVKFAHANFIGKYGHQHFHIVGKHGNYDALVLQNL